jgi:emp24/gp25L/p24 family/GOLD
MTSAVRTPLRDILSWYFVVVAFYLTFGALLVLVSVLIQVLPVPEGSYLLSLSSPFSVLVAPFSGPLSDSASSAGTIFILLLTLLLLLQFDVRFKERWRYRTALCVVPVVSGIVASALYLIPMRFSGLAHDGSGSSIIVAGLNGMLIIMSVAVFETSYKGRRYIDAAFSLVLLLTFAFAFRIGFIGTGNTPAHIYGFLSGLVFTLGYLALSSQRASESRVSIQSEQKRIRLGGSARLGLKVRPVRSFISRLLGTAEKGSVSIDWTVINPIAPAEYRFIVERKIPTVTVRVNSTWSKPITDFEASIRLQDVSDWVSQSREELLGPQELDIMLPLPEEKLHGQEERTVIFELKCNYKDPEGREREYSGTKSARILSKDDMIWSIQRGEKTNDLSPLISAWVTPRNGEVQKIVHESSTNQNAKAVGGMLGYQQTQHVSEATMVTDIPPGKYYQHKLHLRRGAQLRGTLTHVGGGAGNDINFAIVDSDGAIVFSRNPQQFRAPRVTSNHSFSYVAPVESDYYLIFDNTFSSVSSKKVGFSLHIIIPITHEEIVMYQIKAIYETIQRRGFSYVNTPISYAPGASQRVKRPSETLDLKGGNCIDSTVLFASCFEAITLDTIVVLLPKIGHSLVSVRTWSDSDSFFTLETTIVGSSTFEESLRLGDRTMREQGDGVIRISVNECRKQRIMPLG